MRAEKLKERIEHLENLLIQYPALEIGSIKHFAQLMKVSTGAVQVWKNQKIIIVNDKGGLDALRILEKWKKLLERGHDEPDMIEVPPGPKYMEPVLSAVEPHGEPVQLPKPFIMKNLFDEPVKEKPCPFDEIRAKAIQSARESYRDVILEASDDAEKKGDKDLQIRLLKDFVQAEETFKVEFTK